MRILLDTHALLWFTIAGPQLSPTAKQTILDPTNEILISPATFWEIAIKLSIGHYTLNQSYDNFVDLCLKRYRFILLSIEPRHTSRVATLPYFRQHKDPFDRLIVAQALTEDIPVLSIDAKLDAYGVTRLW